MPFKYHLFFCTNQREEGRQCCNLSGGTEGFLYAKDKIKRLGLAGPEGVRVNQAGCLGHCKEGPILVVYPDGVWYTYTNQADIDEIIAEHVVSGKKVERLILPSEKNSPNACIQ